jgi:uncharacterized protein YjbI with pentapeptide repeats
MTTCFRADLAEASLRGADLSGADRVEADLQGADLLRVNVTDEQLAEVKSLEDTTMPNGQKYEDWLKSKNREEDGKNSGSS